MDFVLQYEMIISIPILLQAILEQKNIDIQIIEEFKKLEEGLQKYGLQSPRTLVSVLQMIKQLGYNPRKIVTELARIRSLRQTGRRQKNNCKILESHTNRYQEIIHLCEQLISLEIGSAQNDPLNCSLMM